MIAFITFTLVLIAVFLTFIATYWKAKDLINKILHYIMIALIALCWITIAGIHIPWLGMFEFQ